MTIIKWDPYKTMKQVKKRVGNLFETSVVKSKFSEDEIVHSDWVPAVDIFEDDETIVIKADLPDVDEKDMTIKYDNAILILKGERKFNPETILENYRRIERPYGEFMRKFAVPSNIDVNGIVAKKSGGVLTIYLPKTDETADDDGLPAADHNDSE